MPELSAQKRTVPKAFDGIAGTYDLLTGMNPGYSKHLRMSAARLGVPDEAQLLDLCCGTGVSTAALRDVYPRAEITALDASAGMLEKARAKRHLRASWLLGDAMDPAAAGAEGPYDGILMAYGIRNVPDADACLERLFALLKPGGRICFHEYSVADSPVRKALWNAVTLGVIIPGGMLTAGKTGIYRYLRRSVNEFDGVRGFEARLQRHGFTHVHTEAMDGWQRGIVHSFLAQRPLA
ncbi:MAG: class I SAM-dependent methyltransferase [Myxococcota bacterium]